MLVLSRLVGEKIMIGDNIVLKVNRVQGNKVTLGIEAPKDISILREEVLDKIRKEGKTRNPLLEGIGQ